MTMRASLSAVAALALCAGLSAAVTYPDASGKARVRRIIGEVAAISRTADLDGLGRATMRQSREILDMGASAVYALSASLDAAADWKVRFWIVDIMGYLDNPDARRPLERVMKNGREAAAVRRRARLALDRLEGVSAKKMQRGDALLHGTD